MVQSTVECSTGVVVELGEEAPIRVLHVDDASGFLKVAKQCLEMEGAFQVDTVSSVKEALEKMKKKTYDVIVSDYLMPGKDGLEFLKEVRDSGNTVPFIVFTGKGREEVAIEALNLGADQYLNKSGDPETVYGELAHNIRKVVKSKKAEEKIRESEQRYRNVVELSPNGIVTTDLKGVITSCNTAAKRLLGYPKDELVGKHFSKIGVIRMRDLPKYLKLFTDVLRGKKTKPLELTFCHKDGTPILLETRVGLLKKDGKTVGIQAISTDISERGKAEEALRESEELYRTLIHASPDAIIMGDLTGKIMHANPQAAKMSGFKNEEEIIGVNPFHFIIPEDQERAINNLVKTLKTGITRNIEYTLIRKDGTRYHAELNNVLIRDPEGKPKAFLSIMRDVTKRKKAEEALMESEEKYRALIERANDGIVIAQGNRVKFLNNRFAEMLGYKKEELEDAEFTKLIPPENLSKLMDRYKRRLAGEKVPSVYETTLLKKNGERIPVEMNAGVIQYQGKPANMSFIRDITERKRAEKAIRESQKKFERLFMNNPEAAVYADPDFRILEVNPRFEELFGYSLDEIKGKHINDVVVQKDKMKEATILDKKAMKGYVYHDTVRKRKDGSLVSVSISAAPIIVESQIAGYVASYKDISQLKRTEKELKETLEKLEAMNEKLRVIGRLTRHDVRNKLSAVIGNVYLAKLADDHRVQERLSAIESACRQAVRIFDFARTYERLGAEELAYMDVEENFEVAVSLFSDLHGVKVVNDCRGLTVLADSLLTQLFYNLVDNSLKHGGKVSQIRVHYEDAGKDQLKLVYEDDGVGIPKVEKETIFREGYGKGTGYGLYLIRKMCEAYGWTIRETGKPCKGAQFTITIPKVHAKF